MKHLCTSVIIALLYLSSCGGNGDTDTADTDATTSATYDDSCGHDPVEELTYFHGKTEEEVIEALGAPDCSSMLYLHQGETLPEFYIEIHNTYDPHDPAIEGVEIHDLQWVYDDHCKAVFTHQVDGEWIVLESVRWDHGVEF